MTKAGISREAEGSALLKIESAVEALPPGRLVLAVSGGIDSIVLLDAAARKGQAAGIDFVVAHIDHALRETSKRDVEAVRSFAAQYNLPFALETLGPLPAGENVESWGRRERYRALDAIRERSESVWIVTAHHEDDLVETLLLRLLANKEPRSILEVDTKRRVIRPFLRVSRAEIAEYAKARGLEHTEDETNADVSFTRNRVRHLLIPFLETHFEPAVRRVLAERAAAFAKDIELLDGLIEPSMKVLEAVPFGTRDWLAGATRVLSEAAAELRWRIAERMLLRVLGFRLGRRHSRRVVEFFLENRLAIELPGGTSLRREAGGIALRRERST